MNIDETNKMMTTTLEINVVSSIEDAPKYESDTTLIRLEKALVVRKGTKESRSTVDLQCVDKDGNKFVIMATGRIMRGLAHTIGDEQ